MAEEQTPAMEPAFAWVVMLLMGAIVLSFASLAQYGAQYGSEALSWELALGGALSFLGTVAVTAAMAEPQPKKLRAGGYPLRLRAAWSYMGLTSLPPYPWLRVGLMAAALWSLAERPFSMSSPGSAFAAAALAAAAYPRRSRSALVMEGADVSLFAVTAAASLWACSLLAAEDPAVRVRAGGALLALVLLACQQAREVMANRWKELAPDLPPPPALDLSRFQVSVARDAPAVLPAPSAEGEQLVGSGSFKVDAAKMVEKLRERQLADPQGFILAWLRCAAASGAKAISLEQGFSGLELSFDGRPFSPDELAQPYQVLIDGDGRDAARGRHFAYGLLALQRLNLAWVRVDSVGPQGKASMSLSPSGKAPAEGAPPASGTRIRVGWPSWVGWWRGYNAARTARLGFGLGPAELRLNGTKVPGSPEGWFAEERGGWRLASVARPNSLGLHVRVYVLGTFVEEFDVPDGPKAEAWMGHDGLELNISQSAAQRGRLFEEGVGLARRSAASGPG